MPAPGRRRAPSRPRCAIGRPPPLRRTPRSPRVIATSRSVEIPPGSTRRLGAYTRAAAQRPGDPGAELRLARAEAFRCARRDRIRPARKPAWEASARAAERALRTLAPTWAAAIDAGEDAGAAAARVDARGAEPLYLLAQGAMRAAQATGPSAVLAVKDAALGDDGARGGARRAGGRGRPAPRARRLARGAAGRGGRRRRRGARALRARAGARAGRPARARRGGGDLRGAGAGREPLFEQLLGEVLEADPERDPARAPEARVARRRAQELLERKARLF